MKGCQAGRAEPGIAKLSRDGERKVRRACRVVGPWTDLSCIRREPHRFSARCYKKWLASCSKSWLFLPQVLLVLHSVLFTLTRASICIDCSQSLHSFYASQTPLDLPTFALSVLALPT
jgi:hypothetical protein